MLAYKVGWLVKHSVIYVDITGDVTIAHLEEGYAAIDRMADEAEGDIHIIRSSLETTSYPTDTTELRRIIYLRDSIKTTVVLIKDAKGISVMNVLSEDLPYKPVYRENYDEGREYLEAHYPSLSPLPSDTSNVQWVLQIP